MHRFFSLSLYVFLWMCLCVCKCGKTVSYVTNKRCQLWCVHALTHSHSFNRDKILIQTYSNYKLYNRQSYQLNRGWKSALCVYIPNSHPYSYAMNIWEEEIKSRNGNYTQLDCHLLFACIEKYGRQKKIVSLAPCLFTPLFLFFTVLICLPNRHYVEK